DRSEGAPLDKLHGQEGPTIGEGADLMDCRNAGVLQLAGDTCLAEEALGGRRGGRETIGQQLYGDVAVEGGIARAIDDAHAAVADLVEQFVALRAGWRSARLDGGGPERSGGGWQGFGHGVHFGTIT